MLSVVCTGPVLGGHSQQLTSWGGSVSMGGLQHGQSKDLVLRMSVPAAAVGQTFLSVTVKFNPGQQAHEYKADIALPQPADNMDVEVSFILFLSHIRQHTYIDDTNTYMYLIHTYTTHTHTLSHIHSHTCIDSNCMLFHIRSIACVCILLT